MTSFEVKRVPGGGASSMDIICKYNDIEKLKKAVEERTLILLKGESGELEDLVIFSLYLIVSELEENNNEPKIILEGNTLILRYII